MDIKNVDVIVPAGKYVLGDPCYAVPDRFWDELLVSCNYFQNPIGYVKTSPYEKDKHYILAFHTRWGDGEYWGTNGMSYPVDAGLIGLVPVELVEDLEEHYQNIVTFSKDTVCSYDGSGELHFGGISIETDPQEDENE